MSVASDNTSYRRGLLLGLTMAEIMTLVIFLLMLAFSVMLEKDKKVHEIEVASTEKNKAAVERIIRAVNSQEPARTEEFVKAVESLPGLIELIRKSNLAAGKDEAVAHTMAKAIENMAAAQKKSVKSSALRKKKGLESAPVIANEGRGVDAPSCWQDAAQNPEFIFNVDLTSSGIIIRDNPVPERTADKARLPLKNIKFDRLRSVSEFRAETRNLFETSKRQDCRFFVLLYDKTGPGDKAVYKQLLSAVEEHFYKKFVDRIHFDQMFLLLNTKKGNLSGRAGKSPYPSPGSK